MSLLEKVFESFAAQNASFGGAKAPSDEPHGRLLEESSPEELYANHDKIRERIWAHVEECSRTRFGFERNWFRNPLYYIGRQWLTWDQRGGRWREKRLVRKWVPKPVNNRFASSVDAIRGALQSFVVRPSVWPATTDTDDIASAEVADRFIPVIEDEVDMPKLREFIAAWMSLNADAFAFPYYDQGDKTLGMTTIEHYRCLTCQYVASPQDFEPGTCPQCQAPAATEPALDEMGRPLGEEYPVGRLRCDILSPLECYLTQDMPDLTDHRVMTLAKPTLVKHVKYAYPETGQHVSSDRGGKHKTAQYFMDALAYMSEDGGYVSGRNNLDRTTLFRHVELPSQDFPEGLACTIASDDTILEVGPSPFFEVVRGQKNHYFPLVQFPYWLVPGRLYSKCPAYDLISKQDQLNQLESLIMTAIMKGTYNSWLLPTGSSITNLAGDPAQLIRYTPQGMANGAKPEVITTNPVPPAVFQYKQEILADFEDLSGISDVLKGQVPKGVSAGYAVQMLTDRAFGKFGPVFANMERSYTKLYTILLKLAREYFTEERIKRIRGASGQWQIEKFKGADIAGSVDVKIEGGAERPRSAVAKQALIQSLTQMGFINPMDPKTQYQVLEEFSMQHMLGGVDEDKRDAAKEWEAFLQWEPKPEQMDQDGKVQGGPVVKLVVDNHLVHILDHQSRAKTDQFDQLPHDKQVIWQQHIQDHMNAVQPPPAQPGKPGSGQPPPTKTTPATSKANEMGDQTMNVNRTGGNSALGAGGA